MGVQFFFVCIRLRRRGRVDTYTCRAGEEKKKLIYVWQLAKGGRFLVPGEKNVAIGEGRERYSRRGRGEVGQANNT